MTRHAPPGKGPLQDGFSLIELLVSVVIFATLLAIFATSITIMFKDVRLQLGRSNDLDGSRQVLTTLDHQVRYANAINNPGSTGAAGSLVYWVEWQSGNIGQQQTCTQWRLLPTGSMQYRTWLPSLSGNGTATGLTAWNTRATKISPPTAGSPSVAVNPFAFPPPAVLAATTRQQLVVSFMATYGAPPVKTNAQVTLTAQNTSASAALLSPVCQEVARS